MRFLATWVQKTTTGTMMSNKVTASDLASGPNMSLPLKMNIFRPFQT
uniref:Uncharacterized protein n=1 Tax=Rhizophora mucronata TaxID=61149 RepID=A0A2P2N344_RHIMU